MISLSTMFLPYVLIAAVIALLVILMAKVGQLYKNHYSGDKGLNSVMAFALRQIALLDGDSKSGDGFVCLHLIGGIDFIGKKQQLSVKERQILTIRVLKECLGLSAKELSHYYSIAANRKPNSKQEEVIRGGAMAAKNWMLGQEKSNEFEAPNNYSQVQLSAS